MKKLVAASTILAVLAAGAFSFVQLGDWLSVRDAPRRVDVIVVPAGDPDHRVPAALSHLEAGRGEEVWVTVSPDGPVLEEREAITGFAAERGLRDRVRLLGPSESQAAAAQVVARRLENLAVGDGVEIAVVTSPWTLTRARITYSRVLGSRVDVSVWPDGRRYAAGAWWRREASRTAVEATKLVGTLALFGARPVSEAGDVPLRFPLRALGGGFLVALLAGAACRPLARRLRLVAHPRLLRAHSRPVPLLGGLAILAGLAGGVVAGGGFAIGAAGAVAAGGVVTLALVGFVDDIVGLGARSRLVWAALAGTAAWLLGLRAQAFGPGIVGDVGDAVLTVVWFVGITHAMNLLDNTDGAAAGVGAVAGAALSAIAMASGQWVVAVGAASLAGACAGYLVHNVHPARLFMGDLGALGVGFALAALGIGLRPGAEEPLSFAVAVFVLGVPIFDTVLVTISRVRSGRPVGTGGTDHPAHRLIARGWSVPRAAAALWGGQAVLGAAAYAVATAPRVWGWVLVVMVGVVGLGTLALFLRLPPWRPKVHEEGGRGVAEAIDRAVGPLREVIRTGRADGLGASDRETMRAAEDTLTRLERARRVLRDE